MPGWQCFNRSRCSGKFVAPENYSHTQQYGLGLRLRIGLNLGLGVGLRLGLGLGLARVQVRLGLALVTLWQYGGGKNFPGATNFSRHRVSNTSRGSGVFRIWQRGGHGERAEREPITGVWRRSPPAWSWNIFCFWTFNGCRKFAHFFEIWKRRKLQRHIRCNLKMAILITYCIGMKKRPSNNGKKRTFSYKIACKKFSWSGQRGRHRTVPPS